MRRSALAFGLLLALTACSGSETSPETAEATPLPGVEGEEQPGLSSDPFADLGNAPSTESAAMATPVETPSSGTEIPDDFMADSGSNGRAQNESSSLSSSPSLSEPTPPEPMLSLNAAANTAAAPLSSIPAEVPAPSVPPPAPMVVTPHKQSTREAYQDYKRRVEANEEFENELEDRALFPHEDGRFQFGLDYAYQPFDDLDYDTSATVKNAETMGGALTFNYFPLRSLSYGRIGVGGQIGAYWSKFSFNTGTTTVDTSKKHSIDTAGGRLTYEAQFLLGQILVPFAFYGYEQVRVRSFQLAAAGVNYPQRRFNSSVYGWGLSLNLNGLEPSSASRALASNGIRKSYLTYTMQQRSENTGAGHYLGLRFEF